MTDKGIQKIIVPQNELPFIKNNGEYFFRYRIKYKNNSAYSEWSTKYTVSMIESIPTIVQSNPIRYTMSSIDNNQKIQISWTMPDILDINKFDIYLKWYDGAEPDSSTQNSTSWTKYPKTVVGKSLDIDVPSGMDWVQIAVLASSFPIFIGTNIDNEETLLFKTSLRKIPITLDGGGPLD